MRESPSGWVGFGGRARQEAEPEAHRDVFTASAAPSPPDGDGSKPPTWPQAFPPSRRQGLVYFGHDLVHFVAEQGVHLAEAAAGGEGGEF